MKTTVNTHRNTISCQGAWRMIGLASLFLYLPAPGIAQTGPFTVSVRFGLIDTTCYPNCDHPTEWALELSADLYDGAGNLLAPSTSYLYEWGVDFCSGFGFAYGWATGMGLSNIRPDGNKKKNDEGCCQLCPYQTYKIGVRVTINGTPVVSPLIRIPDGFSTVAVSNPAFPNPLRLSSEKPLNLPIESTTEHVAAVFVLSSSFDLVLARDYSVIESFGRFLIAIPSSDLSGRVSSGMYFVVARIKEKEYRWKVALVR